jgi:hypothetical protein
MTMEGNHGLPRPRHSYMHVPQPGRRGVLVYNGQIPNNSAPAGVYPGGGGGMGMGMNMGYGASYGGAGYYPGVGAYPGAYGSQMHTTPLYYGPNASHSTYSPNYYNYPSSYYNYPSYSYYSPYASYGVGCGNYANYYYPYQRSYYTAGVAAPAYSYAYQTMAPAVAVPVMPATYGVNTQVPMTTTPTYRASDSRLDSQHEARVIAMRRGAYLPRYVKPADARPDDPFWCQERGGEWHLRSFYQIENECQPGEWLMDPKIGNLVFHRR